MSDVVWARPGPDNWFRLLELNFSSIKTIGVYTVWCYGPGVNYTVRCGQGIVGARLTVHKNDPTITKHARNGTLLVTWAAVPAEFLDAVEGYLADRYRPVEGDRYPAVPRLAVNLPGA